MTTSTVGRSEKAKNTMECIPVSAATYTTVTFNVAAPKKAELIVEHWQHDELLARECRGLPRGERKLEIKTHPDASHIACSLQAGNRPITEAKFSVTCGDPIEATGRNFIVIGAMKAGTTTLYHLLNQNPVLSRTYAELPGSSFTKEINYFNKLYREGNTDLHYDWRFPFDRARHAWTLDISPNYAKLPWTKAVPERIAKLGGETRLAYILREPVDRIESNLAHRIRRNKKLPSFNRCVRTSSYALHMDKFTEHIPRENILLLDFYQLQHDPAAVQAQICDFLEIDRFIAQTKVRNQRDCDYQLDETQRMEFAEALRPDVDLLINKYGFEPAKAWLESSSGRRS